MVKRNYFLSAILLLTGLLVIIWYQWRDQFIEIPEGKLSYNKPDYIIESFKSRIYAESGELHYEIKSRMLSHFPLDDSIQLEKPWITFYEENGTPWVVEADKGSSVSSDEFILSGNVKIKGTVAEKSPVDWEKTEEDSPVFYKHSQVKMNTDTLTLHIKNLFASTHDPVTIFNEKNKIESTGLEADFRNDVLVLSKDVKGIYVFD